MVSVIIPTYNEQENLIELKAFFDQIDTKAIEIIVSDSAFSNDDVESQVLSYGWKYITSDQINRAKQMNLGAAKADGDVLCFLHADVRPPKSFCQDIKNSMDKGFEFGFFAYQFNPSSFLLDINANFTKKKGLFAGGGDQIHFIKKSVFQDMNGYDENYVLMEDFAFFKKYKKRKKDFTIIQNRATVSSRKYASNSYVRVNLLNLFVFILFRLNVDNKKIKKIYENWLKK